MADEPFREQFQETFGKRGVADRSYTRVSVSFPVRFMPVSKEEAERLRQVYIQRPSRERGETVSLSTPHAPASQATPGTVSAAILAQLERIERKLDRLLSAQAAGGEPGKEKSLEEAQCIDLSGSGVLFTSKWAMGKGWYLKLVVDVPEPQGFSVVALGRVVRVDQEPTSNLYVTACQFDAIHEEDREELIAYIFKRHRELAQMRRGQDQDEGEQKEV
ncbi:MAG: hypothetical protein A3J27_15530 [Candidatus Tectomicrobia bacterium RIFCSPLOWO2_12_FULL_69_37]|nr:MAG: hypothetical protein A3I72_02225 [Candidatus Tectomicrobia bacterium RIFCSPLOWO2_02_FULL_70_19]OGL68512.1 MAG: hypothetical protein A3J27_15530 [Candidatus Tectomicrobia bacterium RIFCSPLOWO2_12_FULL_69_37]